ncbi:hypothetical protein ACKAV7_011385 [Fusarium commune]
MEPKTSIRTVRVPQLQAVPQGVPPPPTALETEDYYGLWRNTPRLIARSNYPDDQWSGLCNNWSQVKDSHPLKVLWSDPEGILQKELTGALEYTQWNCFETYRIGSALQENQVKLLIIVEAGSTSWSHAWIVARMHIKEPPVMDLESSESDDCPPSAHFPEPVSLKASEETSQEEEEPRWRTSTLIISSSHFVVMNTSGFTNCFGALQSYFIDEFSQSSSLVSWIGSMQIFLFFFIGTFSGRLTDAGYFRITFFTGSLIHVVSILAASFRSELRIMFLTLGLGVGLGNGLMSCPMLAVMSQYFTKRRGMASLLGLYISIFFIVDFSRTSILPPLSYRNSLNLLMIFNRVNAIGRFGSGLAADKFGVLGVFVPILVATSLALFTWISVRTVPSMYLWTVFCGILCGGIQSLFPAGLGYLTAGTEQPGTRMGMIFGLGSIASLIGSPIGGALVEAMDGNYLGAQSFGGATMGLSALFLEATRRADKKTACCSKG